MIADLDFRHPGSPPCGPFSKNAPNTYIFLFVARFSALRQNYMLDAQLCQDFLGRFAACLPKAIINTIKPITIILSRQIVRSKRIAAVETLKSEVVPWSKMEIIAKITLST